MKSRKTGADLPVITRMCLLDECGEWAAQTGDGVVLRASFNRYWSEATVYAFVETSNPIVSHKCAGVPKNRKDLLLMYAEVMARQVLGRRLE